MKASNLDKAISALQEVESFGEIECVDGQENDLLTFSEVLSEKGWLMYSKGENIKEAAECLMEAIEEDE